MSHNNAILVLGAGELGMSVIRNLARRSVASPGHTIAVLLRPSTLRSAEPAKQQDIAELRALGVELLPGDLAADSQSDLAALFKPFDTVVSCTGFVGGKGVQLKLARAALEAGIERYFPWQFGVDYDVIGRGSPQDLFDEQLDVRELLRSQSKTEWVIVSTGMFTSFLFEPSFGVVDLENDTVNALGSWDNAVTATTPEDIGTLTAEILFAEPRIRNQIVYTAGDTISYERLADTVDKVLGRRVRRVQWDMPRLRKELAGEPDSPIRKYRAVFGEGKGVAWDKNQTFNMQRGFDVLGVEEWMQRNL